MRQFLITSGSLPRSNNGHTSSRTRGLPVGLVGKRQNLALFAMRGLYGAEFSIDSFAIGHDSTKADAP